MKKCIKYPKTDYFRSVIKKISQRAKYVGKDENGKAVYDETLPLPQVRFRGTVKLHGTNAAVSYNKQDGLWAQSRPRVITPEDDNAGFAFFVESHRKEIMWLVACAVPCLNFSENTVTIYGEWCGKGIQRGTAVNKLEKMWVIFGVKVTPHDEEKEAYWELRTDHLRGHESGIYHVRDFTQYVVWIDFNKPSEAQAKIVEMVEEVEKECPVGKYFGVSGIGEGIVFTGQYKDAVYRFKAKGDKHSVSKVKTIAAVDIEKQETIDAFAEYAVTVRRLEQGLEEVFGDEDIDMKRTGDFLKWIVSDVLTEELDTLAESGLEPKDAKRAISKKAVSWFKQKCQEV